MCSNIGGRFPTFSNSKFQKRFSSILVDFWISLNKIMPSVGRLLYLPLACPWKESKWKTAIKQRCCWIWRYFTTKTYFQKNWRQYDHWLREETLLKMIHRPPPLIVFLLCSQIDMTHIDMADLYDKMVWHILVWHMTQPFQLPNNNLSVFSLLGSWNKPQTETKQTWSLLLPFVSLFVTTPTQQTFNPYLCTVSLLRSNIASAYYFSWYWNKPRMSTITQNIFIVNPLVRFHIWFSCKLCLISVYIYQSLQNLNCISQESQRHISRKFLYGCQVL